MNHGYCDKYLFKFTICFCAYSRSPTNKANDLNISHLQTSHKSNKYFYFV